MLLKAILLGIFAIIVLGIMACMIAAEKADANIDIIRHLEICNGKCKDCDIEDTCKIRD